MVNQRESKQAEAIEDQGPKDPGRRKVIAGLAGGAGFLALGGAFWLGRRTTEQSLGSPQDATSFDNEPVPSTQFDTDSTTPQTTPTTTETTEAIPSTTTAAEAEGETLPVSLESLPTSVDDPNEWVDKVYGLLHTVFNDTRWDLFGYIYNGGLEGAFGEEYAPDITATKSFRENYPDEYFEFEASVVESRTTPGHLIISVDETRSFMENSNRRIVDYGILPKTILVDSGNGAREVELYLINRATVVCRYDENGVCS